MAVWSGKKGESKACVVIQQVLACYWTRTRCRLGEKTKAGAIVKDVKDGQKVKIVIVPIDGGEEIKTIEGTLQGGKVEEEWTTELPQKAWGDHAALTFDVLVNDRIKSTKSQRPLLRIDLGSPDFSL